MRDNRTVKLARHLAALAGYTVLSFLYSFPLVKHLTTRFPGSATEAFNCVWNLWHFRYAVERGLNPLWTDHQYLPGGGNLMLVHYTMVSDAIAYVLSPRLGLPLTYNLLFLSSIVLAGYAVFLLLTDWEYEWDVAFVGGAALAFSPAVTLQFITGRGLDYMGIFPIPFFLWSLSRALRDEKIGDVVLAAFFLSLSWFFNYYYFLSCLLLLPVYYVLREKPLTLSFTRRPGTSRVADVLLVGTALWAGRSLLAGQTEFHGAGGMRAILVYVAPYLAFWAASALKLLLRYKPSARWDLSALKPSAWGPYAAVIVCWVAMSYPLIASSVYFMATGDYGAPSNRWRGGGNPADLAFAFLPHHLHPWFGEPILRFFGPPSASAISFGLVPMAAALWLLRRSKDAWTNLWFWTAAFFFVLNLGPWLKVAGVHTYLPLPFYFLHMLPVFINMPAGTPFMAITACLLAILLAEAVRALKTRYRWAALAAAALLCVDFAHVRTPTFALEFPGLIHRLRERPDGAVMLVPATANFHYMVHPGLVGLPFMHHELAQTVHQKPITGGHLGRVARRVYEQMMGDPVFSGVVRAQEGGPISSALTDRKRMARYLRDMRLSYVLADASKIPPGLAKAMERWPLKLIDSDGDLRLYAVVAPR